MATAIEGSGNRWALLYCFCSYASMRCCVSVRNYEVCFGASVPERSLCLRSRLEHIMALSDEYSIETPPVVSCSST